MKKRFLIQNGVIFADETLNVRRGPEKTLKWGYNRRLRVKGRPHFR